ncbi:MULTISPECIES: mechanosensitive ion channel family protein [Haloferax]|uniref:Mechanosensitive ion channel n=2 Tax=Haloferax TaxID=2251 RepID=A0A6G1YYU0_9EURY|nr:MULTISPECIES: mechanosensitive ion channel domain-containing protein [Haloferax]KAB1186823.1 mechanosensitive ion channel [Haloferax sp. CBA1149]MRW79450.1 mechanosensitive ion channel [Haloferax marinisediminis]
MLTLRPVVAALFGQVGLGELTVYEDVAGAGAGFVFGAVVVYLLGRLVFVPTVTRIVSARNQNNPTLETATRTYTHALVVLAAGLAGLVGAGYGSLLTDTALIIAALTLVFGVAGQEVIGALISGLFLVADPDFNVGDWIAWSGGEGVVEAVDFRVTRVRTMNNETISVPNTELTTNALLRPYGRERYRVTERVDIAYRDDVERALRELVEVARADERVLDDPSPNSRIVEFAESSVAVKAEFWVASPMDVNLIDVRSQFRRRVKLRFDEVGLTLGPASGREVSGRLDVDLVGN